MASPEEIASASLALPKGGPKFELTGMSRGPWQADAAHGGAPAALLAREAESHCDDGKMRLLSMSSTFFGPVMLGEIEITSEVVKPGRRQKVIALKLSSGGRAAVEARAILIRVADVELPDTVEPIEPTMTPIGESANVKGGRWFPGDEIAFHRTANTVKVVEGGPESVNHTGAAWFHLDCQVVPGEVVTPAQRAAAAADFGNGLAHPVAFGEFLFVNCDLNLNLLREPEGEWIGVVSRTDVDRIGSGLTVTELHDKSGRFGSASQSLYVDRT
ncbi:MAG: thioesterase family protein [Solirubrobacterales bacterium]|nr:thioesterase family protein [Solirubrobacterales bacterium]